MTGKTVVTTGVYYGEGRETVPLKASLVPESQARLWGSLESLAGWSDRCRDGYTLTDETVRHAQRTPP